MKEKSILILGSSSDISKAVANYFSKNGYEIFLASRKPEEMNSFIGELKNKYNVEVACYKFDVLDYKLFEGFIENLPYLPKVIISLIGDMGIQENSVSDLLLAKKIMRTNYEGPANILEMIAQKLKERNHGAIIGVSSVAGDRGRKSNYIYGSAKAAFTSYLSGLRNKLSNTNVKVITILPGFVKTSSTKNMNLPLLLTSKPEKVAKVIYDSYKNNKDVVYVGFVWKYIMIIIKLIPEFIFKKLNL